MNAPRAAQPTDILRTVPSPPSAGAAFDVERIALARAREQADDESVGERVARFRREKGLTQEELALTKILGVSADDLLGLQASKARPSAIKNRRLLRHVQAPEKLPKRNQQAVIRTIEAFLAKAG